MDNATPVAPTAGAVQAARWRGVALALLVNAVPLIGVLRYEWSAINVLVLYWFENVLIGVCTCIRIAVHRRLTRKKGYWRRSNQLGIEVNDKPVQASLLGGYAMGFFIFTGAHGVFVGAIALILHENFPDQTLWQVSFDQIVRGVGLIAVFLGGELLADLSTIRYRSYAWMQGYAEGRMGRVIVLHLTIIFGMFAMAMTESPMGILYVLIGLKTLTDVGGVIGRTAPPPGPDAPPPAWTLRLADRMGKDKGGAKAFMKKWEADQEQARRNAIEDEEVMPDDKR